MAAGTEDYLLLSGIQHFCFCRRQWALIHVEQQWSENLHTAEGRLEHARCHDDTLSEKRRDRLLVRGMQVVSHRLRLSGVCDVVEFRADPAGVSLWGREGLWMPLPVEYKHGRTKESDADRLQLCAQAMCLEEMYGTRIPSGAIFFITAHRRAEVAFTPALRAKTEATASALRALRHSLSVPAAEYGRKCQRCSLKELCMPKTALSAKAYCQALAREAQEVDATCENC